MSSLIERKTHLKDSAALSSVLKGCISPFRNVDDADRVGSPLGLLRAENCSGQPYHRGGTPGSKVALCEHRLHSYLGILVMPRSKPTSRVVLRQGQQGGGNSLGGCENPRPSISCLHDPLRMQLPRVSTTAYGRQHHADRASLQVKAFQVKAVCPVFLVRRPRG